ncbi:hypothetical protein [Tateyamaria pelophila]|uniref:hypothetical protein n=1 Tax=Tateyamaria pelophila TaxID=328415 RepID=UPI001CC0167D|nr:hypothetical protein [Tateyamaria pelophila]
MVKVKVDEVEYDTDDMSEHAVSTATSLRFVNARLQQLQNELAIADTARIAYRNALRRELDETK